MVAELSNPAVDLVNNFNKTAFKAIVNGALKLAETDHWQNFIYKQTKLKLLNRL